MVYLKIISFTLAILITLITGLLDYIYYDKRKKQFKKWRLYLISLIILSVLFGSFITYYEDQANAKKEQELKDKIQTLENEIKSLQTPIGQVTAHYEISFLTENSGCSGYQMKVENSIKELISSNNLKEMGQFGGDYNTLKTIFISNPKYFPDFEKESLCAQLISALPVNVSFYNNQKSLEEIMSGKIQPSLTFNFSACIIQNASCNTGKLLYFRDSKKFWFAASEAKAIFSKRIDLNSITNLNDSTIVFHILANPDLVGNNEARKILENLQIENFSITLAEGKTYQVNFNPNSSKLYSSGDLVFWAKFSEKAQIISNPR